jgi:hypothetical protein
LADLGTDDVPVVVEVEGGVALAKLVSLPACDVVLLNQGLQDCFAIVRGVRTQERANRFKMLGSDELARQENLDEPDRSETDFVRIGGV